MARRNALEFEDVSASVDDLLMALAPRPPDGDGHRKTSRTPHEEGRAARFIGLTLPSPAWRQAILQMAQAWGMKRLSDFITYCIAYTMAAILAGRLRRPAIGPAQFHHRTGENLKLPWSPE